MIYGYSVVIVLIVVYRQISMKVKNIKKNYKAKMQADEGKYDKRDKEADDGSSIDSNDEIILNRRGVIPRQWYDDMEIQGYNVEGNQIMKQKQNNKLEQLIQKTEDKDWWKTIRDELNDKDIVLTDQQMDLLERIRGRKYANKLNDHDYQVEYDWNEGIFPLSAAPKSKKQFMPSQYERKLVNRLVLAIKQGKINVNKQKKKEEEDELMFDIWESTDNTKQPQLPQLKAPKLKLPGHQESYNPSIEYLFDEQEQKEWEEEDPDERKINYIPKKYDSLRKVETYSNLIIERFERCLDLYLQPRLRKKKLNIDPESLIPKLPQADELRPFPTQRNIYYEGHESRVRSISVLYNGVYLASCDEKGWLIVWDINTGRKLIRLRVIEDICYQVQWNQDSKSPLLAVGHENGINIYGLNIFNKQQQQNQHDQYEQVSQEHQKQKKMNENGLEWEIDTDNSINLIKIKMENSVKHIDWHVKGDYLVSVSPDSQKKNEIVWVHSIQKAVSQRPFNKSKSNLEKAVFHPTKPLLILMCRTNIFIYNLQKQEMVKKLDKGGQWNSSIAVHPKGDNILVGGYDRKVVWYDLDLGTSPYKMMKYHEKAVRKVAYHHKYPLFATCSDDCSVHIFHGNVYTDLMQNALIVPLKVLKGHKYVQEIGVLDIEFHPSQPWILSAGADHNIILWT